MSLLLSAQIGEAVTPAQLLGTEAEEKEVRARESQRKVRDMEKRLQKAGFGSLKDLAKSTATMKAGAAFDEGLLKP